MCIHCIVKLNIFLIYIYISYFDANLQNQFETNLKESTNSMDLSYRCSCINLYQYHKQKQPFRGVLRKRHSENMQQVYRRTPMPKCDFNKALRHVCSPVNLLHIFRTLILKNTSGWLLLYDTCFMF